MQSAWGKEAPIGLEISTRKTVEAKIEGFFFGTGTHPSKNYAYLKAVNLMDYYVLLFLAIGSRMGPARPSPAWAQPDRGKVMCVQVSVRSFSGRCLPRRRQRGSQNWGWAVWWFGPQNHRRRVWPVWSLKTEAASRRMCGTIEKLASRRSEVVKVSDPFDVPTKRGWFYS